jgi:hypothetical protein
MSVIRRHPVITFFLLTYALSWAAIPWQSFFAPGVLVAALIVVSLTEGVAGLKAMGSRLIRWRVSWIWYALALAVPLAVTFAEHPVAGRCRHNPDVLARHAGLVPVRHRPAGLQPSVLDSTASRSRRPRSR